MIKIKSLSKLVVLGTTEETTIREISIPMGKKVECLEVLPVLAEGCKVYIYLGEERHGEFEKGVADVDIRRRVVNWGLTPETTIKVTGINTDVADHLIGIELLYDETLV